MSDQKFSDHPPRNGKQVLLTGGHANPTPYHVEVWINGELTQMRPFASMAEAERFQMQESVR